MIGKLKRIFRFFYNYLKSGNIKVSVILSKYPLIRYQNQYYQMRFVRNGIQLIKNNLFVPISAIDKFQADFELIERSLKFTSISFDDDEMIVSIFFNNHDIKIIIRNYDSLSTIEDIFSYKVYSFNSESVDDYVIIDIGMNIGIASLYFASFPSVKKVYAYEPFKVNYSLALQNFELNPKISGKINPINAGIDSVSRTIFLPCINEGDVGFGTIEVKNSTNIKTKDSVKIDLIGINEVMKLILKKKSISEKIYLKLDCEGAEYEIMEALSESGEVNKISAIELEWHYKGVDIFENIFRDNNFQINFSNENKNGYTGIIQAINKEY